MGDDEIHTPAAGGGAAAITSTASVRVASRVAPEFVQQAGDAPAQCPLLVVEGGLHGRRDAGGPVPTLVAQPGETLPGDLHQDSAAVEGVRLDLDEPLICQQPHRARHGLVAHTLAGGQVGDRQSADPCQMAQDRRLAARHDVTGAGPADELPDRDSQQLGLGFCLSVFFFHLLNVQHRCTFFIQRCCTFLAKETPVPYNPYDLAVPARAFTLTSSDFPARGELPSSAYNTEGGANESPALAWTDLPEGTRSLAVAAFDADAPIPGGLWHWAVKDIPASLPGLPRGAGRPGGAHPGAPLPNDLGQAGYSGVNPPPGTGTHRLYICATALDVPTLDVPEGASLAMFNILMIPHTLGRAILTGTSQAPDA
ncbi:Raf kinase inhibitor-like YbhB/YbcL family protein [Streptacidiphilus sp. MAP5-52]